MAAASVATGSTRRSTRRSREPPAARGREGPLITADEMRQQAHGRIERGTSCWLAKKCEDSNVYRRDPEIQATGAAVDPH